MRVYEKKLCVITESPNPECIISVDLMWWELPQPTHMVHLKQGTPGSIQRFLS